MRRKGVEKVFHKYAYMVLSLIICSLIICTFGLCATFLSTSSQELEGRLHTDWAIVDYKVTPSTPIAGERTRLQISIGIATIIEPLPQTVEVILKIDGVQKSMYTLRFERDPTQVLTIQADWIATSGKHLFEWIVDPFSKYADPNLENNYVAFNLEVTPSTEIRNITTTVTVTETVTTTQIEEMIIPVECPEMELMTETLTVGETVTVVMETVKVETTTKTSYRSFTVTEKIIEVEKYSDHLPLGIYGGILALVAGIAGLIIGRRLFKEPRTAVFLESIYRSGKKLDEDVGEAKLGEQVKEAKGIVTVDEKGDVTIISDHECIYSSKILKRPLAREDLERMDRRIIEGLLKQLKSTRETTEAMKLELNDRQKQAIEDVIRRMEEEIARRKRIQ